MIKKYKNLKLNPNKLKNNVVILRCLHEDYEKIDNLFTTIFVTARLFDYRINVFRHSHFSNCIIIHFDCNHNWIFIKISYEHYKIIGINIEKKIISHPKWITQQSFYHHNGFSCKGKKSQEELLRKILNFL